MCKLEADLAYRTSVAFLASKEVPPDAIQGWLDRAEARYRKSLKTLADLQRLQLPVVQVNVGGQQVNIATDHLNLPSLAGAAVPTTPAKCPDQPRKPELLGRPAKAGAYARRAQACAASCG